VQQTPRRKNQPPADGGRGHETSFAGFAVAFKSLLAIERTISMADPFSEEEDAKVYFEAVIAAILASGMNAAGQGTQQETIDLYKEMLQKLRATPGGAFK
jgi:hypothetical protein